MSDVTTSKQKAEYVSHEVIKRGKSDYLQLTYKRLDGDNPGQELKTGAFVATLDESSKDLIRAKGQFVVVKVKQGEYWNMTKVEDISTYVERTPTNSNKSYGTKGQTSTYNTAGIKVGAVLHDAVALAGPKTGVATVKVLAEELLYLSYELEANVNAGKYEPKTINVSATLNPSTGGVILETSNLSSIDY